MVADDATGGPCQSLDPFFPFIASIPWEEWPQSPRLPPVQSSCVSFEVQFPGKLSFARSVSPLLRGPEGEANVPGDDDSITVRRPDRGRGSSRP
jgi:hypothetical protein